MSVSDRLLTGRILSEESAQNRKEVLTTGRILPTPDVVATPKAPLRDTFAPVQVAQGELLSGVVAAGISLNAMRPLQVRPALWDVASAPFALLDDSFSGFSLPDPEPTILDYLSGGAELVFDEQCLLDGGGATGLFPNGGLHNSYVLTATALVTSANPGALFAQATGATLLDLSWSGPFVSGNTVETELSLASHVVNSVAHPHASPDGGPPLLTVQVSEPGTSSGTFDLFFMSENGGPWSFYALKR